MIFQIRLGAWADDFRHEEYNIKTTLDNMEQVKRTYDQVKRRFNIDLSELLSDFDRSISRFTQERLLELGYDFGNTFTGLEAHNTESYLKIFLFLMEQVDPVQEYEVLNIPILDNGFGGFGFFIE